MKTLDSAVFSVAGQIGFHPENLQLPPGVSVESHLLDGGSNAQSIVSPFPGDFHFDELFTVRSASAAEAGAVMAGVVAEFVGRSLEHPRLEFTRLRVMPTERLREAVSNYVWDTARVMDPDQRPELARQLTTLDGGHVNSDWRALADGDRFIIIGKIFSAEALDAQSGEVFFRTRPMYVHYQAVYFSPKAPEDSPEEPLGEYLTVMANRDPCSETERTASP